MSNKKSILFVGNCYYNHFYLSRELRKLGWRADVLHIDLGISSQIFYHGHDYIRGSKTIFGAIKDLTFFIKSIFTYKIFHFSNAWNLTFPPFSHLPFFFKIFGMFAEIKLLKLLGKKIFYTNNGCLDGTIPSSFNKWGPHPVCDVCPWQNNLTVCSDHKNKLWGELRNKLADYIGLLGGNRVDYNNAKHVFEAPWIYCLDKDFWFPEILVPSNYKLPVNDNTVKIYHSVGNYDTRSHGSNKMTIKSTNNWIEIVKNLKADGLDIELLFFKDVSNMRLKYYQAQADIFVDMLTFGFFGANIREAMMLGKPAICFLRPEWLESMREEIPDYVDELPVISALPETAQETLKELVINKEKRLKIGHDMRKFGLKWHASDAAAKTADKIYFNYLVN